MFKIRSYLLIILFIGKVSYSAEKEAQRCDYIEHHSFTVSSEKLSEDREKRRSFLDDYFCETLASAVKETSGEWRISLLKPNCPEFFIDPEIRQNSEIWGGIKKLSEISYFYRDVGNVFESFNDNWTLLSWAQKWTHYKQSSPFLHHQTLTILHLDDHEDLMNPRVCIREDQMFDMITKQEIELSNPALVESALISGAIGIGSFIPPFLFALQGTKIQLRHLSERYADKRSCIQKIHLKKIEDNFLEEESIRLGLHRVNIDEPGDSDSEHCYHVTSNSDEFLSDIPDGPIFIHFDMDYFNDRFDGCSCWESEERCHNPSLPQVMERLDSFLDKLMHFDIKDRIISVTVAVSPGFFPSEMWGITTQRIRDFFNGAASTDA
jgi:hypothetical protein